MIVPSLVYTREQLEEVVHAYLQLDSFAIDVETRGSHPLDPRRNEVFWVGLAGIDRVDAIPIQHSNGVLVLPERFESVLPPEDQRRVLQSGALSNAKVKRKMPAVFGPAPKQLYPDVVFELLEPLLFDPNITKVNHNLKFDIESIAKYYGRPMSPPYWDTIVAQFLVNENLFGNAYKLGPSIERTFGYKYDKLGAKGVDNFSIFDAGRYALQDPTWTLAYKRWLERRLRRQGLEKLFSLEMRVLESLVYMETEGVCLDVHQFADVGKILDRKIRDQEDIAFSTLGYKFSMTNNAQKSEVIYKTLKHTPKRFTAGSNKKFKAGLIKASQRTPSVDAEALKMYEDDPVVAAMLEHAQLSKVKTTFIDGVGKWLVNGRLHSNFKQHGAVTGRLSCSEPNLQQIPRDDPDNEDRSLRSLFVAPKGEIMIVADFDQIELRVIAHYCRDKTMMQTFINGEDIHSATACAVLGVTMEEVKANKTLRSTGKTLNFAISFSAGPTTLAATANKDLKPGDKRLTTEEAKAHLAIHRKQFPALYRWKDSVVVDAKRHKPPTVFTMFGRKRRLPDLNADYFSNMDEDERRGRRMRAERQAVNTRIQGSAADINKLAMVRLYELTRGTPMRPVLTVHDELMAYCPPSFEAAGKAIMTEAMAGPAMQKLLRVPLVISCKAAERWSDAK